MIQQASDFPVDIWIGFYKIIEKYEQEIKKEESPIAKENIQKILDYLHDFPELKEGIADFSKLKNYTAPIKTILNDLFPQVLSDNEIKAATIPFQSRIFNLSNKFKDLLREAGPDFELKIRDLDEDSRYIYTCILILRIFYNYKIDLSQSLYYDIPDENKIIKNYKIDLITDFIEIFPAPGTKKIEDEDVDLLLQNIDDISVWKKMFPPKSYVMKGIAIINLTDVTVEDAISDLKTALLSQPVTAEKELMRFQEIFRSIYKIPDLEVGFTLFNEENFTFEKQDSKSISYIIEIEEKRMQASDLDEETYKYLIEEKSILAIPNVSQFSKKSKNNPLSRNLADKKVRSCLLAPIANKDLLLGVLELVAFKKNELNSINAIKLEGIIPYMATAIQRNKTEFENRIKAVIQSECTSIHPSVLWIFEKEAKKYIQNLEKDGLASFRDIAFDDIHPLYGQVDIVASSEARNEAIQKDLLFQLKLLREIFIQAFKAERLAVYEQVIFRIKEYEKDLKGNLNASSEQQVYKILEQEVHPVMEHIKKHNKKLREPVESYHEKLAPESGVIYNHRKNYDESVQKINRVLARFLDAKQVEAQRIFPHYFERYKTDGVEHNIYIGAALTKKKFSPIYLYNLRIWQLKTICEMENRFYQIQKGMPMMLSAASLILVYNGTISIRYRMDEKKFDIDGTYNARYEIIKKRIDKACIKGTDERITQKGKIAIVYSQASDGEEYLRYIKYLQAKEYLGEKVENLEMEDVQGVIGLKALRVEVLYTQDDDPNKILDFQEFIKDLNQLQNK